MVFLPLMVIADIASFKKHVQLVVTKDTRDMQIAIGVSSAVHLIALLVKWSVFQHEPMGTSLNEFVTRKTTALEAGEDLM